MSNQTVHFSGIREKIIEELKKAKKEVLIAVAWFTDEKIIKILNDLSREGVSISIIIYDDKINKKELFKTLYYQNAEIMISKKMMHNKFCIIDNNTVVNGSYNWTFNAINNNENIQITKDNDEITYLFKQQFFEIKKITISINIYFKNSLNYIQNEINEYNYYYENQIKIIKEPPYFYKIQNFKKNIFHKSINIQDGIVIIDNRSTEYDFFKLLFFLKKDISLVEISKVSNSNFNKPIIYNDIINIDVSKNLFFELLNQNYILINNKQTIEYSCFNMSKKYYQYHLSKIDSNGHIINELKNCKLMPSGYYIVGLNNYEIYDNKLNKIEIKGVLVDYIDNVGYVSYTLKEDKKKYGLWDFDGNNLVEHKFDYYEKDNLRSYKDSALVLLAEYIVSNQDASYLIAEKTRFSSSTFFDLKYKLQLEGIVDEKHNVLINDLNTLKKFIIEKDRKVSFREFPCLVSLAEFYTKETIVKPFIREYDEFKSDYKEYIFNPKSRELNFSGIKKRKEEVKKYYFYSDSNGKYNTLYNEVCNVSYIKQNHFEELKSFVDNNDNSKHSLRVLKQSVKTYERHLYHYINDYNEVKKRNSEKSCYIATMVYGDINHPKVELFRNFRDNTLINYNFGRVFIKYYYRYSPNWVQFLNNKNEINYLIRSILDVFVTIIKFTKTNVRKL